MNDLASDTFPLTGNRLIEASAGTGKTYTITNLYIRLLLGHGRQRPLPVDSILVLTFTNAATEELKHRIRQRIVEAKQVFNTADELDDPFLQKLKENSDDPDRDLKRLTAASQLMDDAAIFTIHGFCARVLGEMSFETGILFDQNLTADRNDLLQIAAEDCFRKQILELPGFEREIALELWDSPATLIQKTQQFLFRSNLHIGPPVCDVSEEFTGLSDKIDEIKQRWIDDDIPAILNDAGFRKNSKVISRISAMTSLCQSTDTADFFSELWEVYSRESLQKALKKDMKLPEHNVLTLIDDVTTELPILDQVKINLWRQITDSLKEKIDNLKIRTSELTIDDLLVQVDRALNNNELLAEKLARRWPVALIDEFQDTDDLQYRIFSRSWQQRDQDNCLLFIGDPKQAIYQFRGADIYTYINAGKVADDKSSLSVNWRSTESMVAAINYLFSQNNIFGNANIGYTSNQPSPRAEHMSVIINGASPPPCHISFLQKDMSKSRGRVKCMDHAGEQIVKLLALADENAAMINDEPIHAGQISLLVRDRNDARAAQTALSARGINSVYVTLESVFLQDTAEDLRLILEAVIDPTNDYAIKAALATSLLRSTVEEINGINLDIVKHQEILSEFQEYHRIWATRDIAPMIEAIITRRRIAENWLHSPGGDRQLTNLRHLAELLQQRSTVAPGMRRLLKWFTSEKMAAVSASDEDRQLRLESDEDLVKIVTLHAAKGLEFDIVMLPMAGFVAWQNDDEPVLFHKKEGHGREGHEDNEALYTTHLNFLPDADILETALEEKYEEDMRLLYVAITRSRYLCYLGLTNTDALDNSAISRLLGLTREENRSVEFLKNNLPGSLFDVSLIDEVSMTKRDETDTNHDALPTPPPIPEIDNDSWRIHSYTGISRRLRKQEDDNDLVIAAGYGDDDNVTQTALEQQPDRFTLTRGPQVGVVLHSLLEGLDFTASEDIIRDRCARYLKRLDIIGQEEQWLDVLTAWMSDVIQTPLPDIDGTFRLSDISLEDRISELEFHFPLRTSMSFLDILRQHGYLVALAPEQNVILDGMMMGIIDLVLRVDGRYYIIDYKSNYLGKGFQQYSSDSLDKAVQDHHYDLQYLIYSVALHRYLRSRLPDYDYDDSFGGVLYLFLRGMQGTSGDTGIYRDSPPKSLIMQLDEALYETR